MYSVGIVITLVFLLASIVVISLYIHSKLRSVKKKEARYDYHFAFISKSEDSYITEHIYEEAFNYGRQHDAYVEKLNAGSNGDYSVADYVEMAASMKADGIILLLLPFFRIVREAEESHLSKSEIIISEENMHVS